MSKALEIAAWLKNKYYCVNTIHGLQSDIENAVEFLREVEERAKKPEMLELILKYALKGVSDKNLELRKQVSDMETVAAMAINEREYKKQTPFIIQKLEAWKHASALRWDDTIYRLKGKL